MTRESQKTTERQILDAYLAARGISDAVVRLGPEPPDFLLEHAGQLTGVEVTEYHDPLKTESGYPRREVEAAWEALRGAVVAYREDHSELDGLSVVLDFAQLRVPPRGQHRAFIDAVAAVIVRQRDEITEQRRDIRITESDPLVLREYVRRVTVRLVDCYMEWDWNHIFAGIGTSELELMANIGPKLRYKPVREVATSWLIVAGGFRHSEIVAAWSVEQLAHFPRLNEALQRGPFDEVGILCMRSFLWTRNSGWQSLP